VAASGERRDSVELIVRRRGIAAPAVPAAGSVAIAPPPPLRVGDSVALTAVVLGSQGDTLAGTEVNWASSDARVATIDPSTGVVRALSPGTALILARSGDETTLSELTVVSGPVAALQILGERPMAVRETLALRVLAKDAWGGEVTETPVTWTTSDSGVASVDGLTGTVVARLPGSASITAASGGVSDRIHLTVLPRPQPVRPGGGDADQQRAEAWVEAGVEECYAALRSKNVGRLAAMYHPDTPTDREILKRLTRILGTSAAAVVGERLDRDPHIGPEDATMEFSVHLTWRSSSGEPLASQPVFRAELARNARGWELSSCRIVGSPPT
jgi:hypothetical protein